MSPFDTTTTSATAAHKRTFSDALDGGMDATPSSKRAALSAPRCSADLVLLPAAGTVDAAINPAPKPLILGGEQAADAAAADTDLSDIPDAEIDEYIVRPVGMRDPVQKGSLDHDVVLRPEGTDDGLTSIELAYVFFDRPVSRMPGMASSGPGQGATYYPPTGTANEQEEDPDPIVSLVSSAFPPELAAILEEGYVEADGADDDECLGGRASGF